MDARNQTVLHHIVSRCELNGYVSSAIYYLTSILEFLQTRDDIYLQQLFLDRKDDDGNTALHIATRNKLLRVSEILILMGCRMDVKDFNGKTQRDISRFDFGLRKMYQGYNSDSDGDFSDLVEENVIEVTQVQKLKFYLEANADLEVDEFTGVGIKRKLDE